MAEEKVGIGDEVVGNGVQQMTEEMVGMGDEVVVNAVQQMTEEMVGMGDEVVVNAVQQVVEDADAVQQVADDAVGDQAGLEAVQPAGVGAVQPAGVVAVQPAGVLAVQPAVVEAVQVVKWNKNAIDFGHLRLKLCNRNDLLMRAVKGFVNRLGNKYWETFDVELKKLSKNSESFADYEKNHLLRLEAARKGFVPKWGENRRNPIEIRVGDIDYDEVHPESRVFIEKAERNLIKAVKIAEEKRNIAVEMYKKAMLDIARQCQFFAGLALKKKEGSSTKDFGVEGSSGRQGSGVPRDFDGVLDRCSDCSVMLGVSEIERGCDGSGSYFCDRCRK